MNQYLARLRGLNPAKQAPTQTLKTLKTDSSIGFEGFEGSCGSPFSENPTACPAFVPEARWRQAIEDGQAFLDQWREQVIALGWTADDLWGLHTPPAKPHSTYNRLSRYDATGLIWLLQGQRVLAMTEKTATISTPSGGTLIYYRYKPQVLGV